MLAEPGGRYRPAEVRVGSSAGGQTEILAGPAAGEKVVASGQFLLDSEANLPGVEARPSAGPTRGPWAPPAGRPRTASFPRVPRCACCPPAFPRRALPG